MGLFPMNVGGGGTAQFVKSVEKPNDQSTKTLTVTCKVGDILVMGGIFAGIPLTVTGATQLDTVTQGSSLLNTYRAASTSVVFSVTNANALWAVSVIRA